MGVFLLINDLLLPDSLETDFIKDNRIDYNYLVRWDVKNKTAGGLDGMHLIPLLSLIKYLADDARNYTIDYVEKIQEDPETYEIGLSNEDALKVRFSTKDIPCAWDLTEYTTTYKGYGLKD